MEVDLRSVERAVAFVYGVRKFKLVQSFAESFGCLIPIFVRTDAVVGTSGKLYVIFESEKTVNFVDKPYDPFAACFFMS